MTVVRSRMRRPLSSGIMGSLHEAREWIASGSIWRKRRLWASMPGVQVGAARGVMELARRLIWPVVWTAIWPRHLARYPGPLSGLRPRPPRPGARLLDVERDA